MTDPIRAVIYAAKSTEDKHGSIPDQLADGRKLASQRGSQVDAEYQDESASAFHGNRGPGLAAALAHCEQIAPCALIVQHSDRLARGDARHARHLIEIVLWTLKKDVELLSVQDPEILAGGDLALLLGAIGGMRNNQDSKRKSLSVKDGARRRAQRGLPNGGPRPYGYQWDHGNLAINEPEAAILRRIYAEFLAGRGQRQIARDLITDGIVAQRGGTWHQGTIGKYLANPVYTGVVTLNGQTHPGKHEAIVDPETWEKAHQLRNALSRTHGKNAGRYPTGQYIFRKGHLRCGCCGEPMIPQTQPTRTPDRPYEVYRCYGRQRFGRDHCPRTNVRREVIETAVWDFFERVALDVEATRQAITSHTTAKLSELDALRDQAARDVTQAEARLAVVKRGWQDEVIDDAEYDEQRSELSEELTAAQAQIERLTAQREQVVASAEQVNGEDAVLAELAMLRSLIAGEAREGSRAGIDAFRATLRRMFDHFTLVPWTHAWDRADTVPARGAPMLEETPTVFLHRDDVLMLIPHVRPEAIEALGLDGISGPFPAMKRVALSLHGNGANGLTITSSPPRSSSRTQ